MKWLAHKLEQVSQYLITYGPLGLFAVALIDSAFLPLPGGPDAVMIVLSAAHPSWLLIYAAAATLGSVAGCIVLYYISRRAGRRALSKFSAARQARVKELLDRYDALTILVASVLPPPFPFKLFVITAGVFRMNVWRLAVAITAGRTFRFLLEGYLAARYGERAGELLARYYPGIGIGVAALVVMFFIGRKVLRRRRRDKAIAAEEQSS